MQHRFFRRVVSGRAFGAVCRVSVFCCGLLPQAEGATHIWTGAGGNALWSNAANWSGGKPTSNEPDWTTVQFGTNTTSTCDISGLVVDVITFTGGGNTINGSTALRIDGDNAPVNVVSTAGNNKFAATLPVIFSVFTPFINVPAGTLTIAGNCSGTPGFRKLGAGTLTLTGTNTYGGATEVASGTLALNSNGLNAAIPGAVTVGLGTGTAGSAVLSLIQPGEIADTAKVTVAADGLFQMNGFPEVIGGLSIHDGKVDLGAGGLQVAGPAIDMIGGSIVGTAGSAQLLDGLVVTATSSPLTGSAIIEPDIFFDNAPLSFVVNAGPTQPELTLKGALHDGSNTNEVIKSGTGEMLLNNATATPNAYTGPTQVQQGTLTVNSNTASAVPGPLEVGTGVSPIVPGSAVVRLERAEQIADTAGVTVYRDGVLDLNGSQESVNKLNVAGGTVNLANGTLTVLDHAGLAMFGGTIAATGNAVLEVNGTVTVNGSLDGVKGATIAPAISLKSTLTLVVNEGVVGPELTLSGPVSGTSPGYGLIQSGGGTLVMTGANTYAGVTQISGATLEVDGTQGPGEVDVQVGSVLSGSGVVGPIVAVADTNVVVAPGAAAAPGILRVSGNATLAGATLKVRLDDNHAAQKCGLLKVSGNLNLTGATLAPLPVGAFSAGPYVIASYGGSGGTLTGTFAHVPSGYSVNYTYNDGTSSRNVALTVTNPYSIWAAGYGLDPATTAVFDADPDRDGLVNGIEFVLGTSPLDTTGGAGLPVAAVSGTDFVFTYRRNGSAVYLNPVLEVSTTLAAGSWTTVSSGISAATNFYGGGVDKVTVTVPMAGRTRLFGRLRVDAP
jgi:autotransporter-associated beta strand protein